MRGPVPNVVVQPKMGLADMGGTDPSLPLRKIAWYFGGGALVVLLTSPFGSSSNSLGPIRNDTQAGYQELVNAIIRPPRARYEVEALGPVEFEFVGKAFKRLDFRLLNDRGHVLECR